MDDSITSINNSITRKYNKSPHFLHSGLPRHTDQTQITSEQLTLDFKRYYKILAKKYDLPVTEINNDLLSDISQAILNTYKIEHRWLEISEINMNPVGYYTFNGDKAEMHKAMEKAIANPTKRPTFLWLHKKWWKFKWKHNRVSKNKVSS